MTLRPPHAARWAALLLCAGLTLPLLGCGGEEEAPLPVIPTEEEEREKAERDITPDNAAAELERLKKEIEEGH